MTRKSTMVEFVTELEKLPKVPKVLEMIEEAKAGEYHDYKNKKYLCGKVEASRKLRRLNLREESKMNFALKLAKRIEDGEFDEPADDNDKAMMRRTLPEALWPMLGL